MRATQLIADPLKIRLKLCFPSPRPLPRHFDPHSHFDLHIRAFPAGNIPAFFHRERPDVHRIRSVEFRGLTAARAGGMCCCSRAWREIEAALGGPLAVADIDGRSFVAKLWLIAPVAADAVSHTRRRRDTWL